MPTTDTTGVFQTNSKKPKEKKINKSQIMKPMTTYQLHCGHNNLKQTNKQYEITKKTQLNTGVKPQG